MLWLSLRFLPSDIVVSGHSHPELESKPFTTSDADIENVVPGPLQVHLLPGVTQRCHFVFLNLKSFKPFCIDKLRKLFPLKSEMPCKRYFKISSCIIDNTLHLHKQDQLL